MRQALISCIVPVYNGELYLREAIDSILAQTYGPLEVIVIDDGSTDGTPHVAAGYGDRLRYHRQPNAGPAAARNAGLNLARGRFVAFLDADDLWHPEKLAWQMARFAACPELELCITQVQHFWIPELRAEEEQFRNHRLASPAPGYLIQALLGGRDLFDRVGFFDPSLRQSEDTDWFLRAIENRVVMEIVPHVLLYHRMHTANLTRRRSAASTDEFLGIAKRSLDHRRQNAAGPALLELPRPGRPEDRGEADLQRTRDLRQSRRSIPLRVHENQRVKEVIC